MLKMKALLGGLIVLSSLATAGCGSAPDFLKETLLTAVEATVQDTISETIGGVIDQALEGGLPEIPGLP